MITVKNKGFTLIELLAVIVILAIIALIATPTILGVIEKTRKGASEQSALGYVDAVEMQVSLNSLDLEKEDIKDGVYTVSQLKKLEVSIKGQSPSDESWIKIKNGRAVAYSLKFGRYTITLDENNNKVIEKDGEVIKKPNDDNTTNPDNPDNSDDNKKYPVYSNGTAVYYNPETNSKCNENEAVSKTGTKTGCMKWYTFNDTENSSTANMILDHDTTARRVLYNKTNENKEQKEVAEQLTSDVSTWNNNLKSRLITAEEVAQITGNASFNGTTSTSDSWFYLDSNNQTQTAKSKGASKYAWLFDYTNECTSYGCNIADSSTYGYWTSNVVAGGSSYAWSVFRSDRLNSGSVDCTDRGVRPVITVSKDIIQ